MKKSLNYGLCLLNGLVILTGCVSDKSVSVQRESGLPEVTIPNGRSPATDNAPLAPMNDSEVNRKGWNHGNGVLWTYLRPTAYAPDMVEKDGSLRVKSGWWKGFPGKFSVEGRRLDAPAPPLRCSVNAEALDDVMGPIPALFFFPTEGYWEITGRLNGKSLTFVIHVVKEPQVKGSSPSASATTQKYFTEVIELPRQTLIFKPTRDDITVGCVIFSLYQSEMGKAINLDVIRVNGARPELPVLYLKQVGKNQFELPALTIEFSSEALGGPLYLSLKAWFNELTNQYDSPFYENAPDRYALLSYCTKEDEDPSKVNARLGANRVATVKEFKEKLAMPFVIKLNQRPLREEWGRYPMLPPGNQLTAAELKAVEQTVRDRGEQFVRAISVSDSDHARVAVGDGTFFRDARIYRVVRSDATWRIESVESIKGSSW